MMENQFQKMLNLIDHMSPFSHVGYITSRPMMFFSDDVKRWCEMFDLPYAFNPQRKRIKLGDRFIHLIDPRYEVGVMYMQGREFKDFFVDTSFAVDLRTLSYAKCRIRCKEDPLYTRGSNLMSLLS